MKMAAKKKTNKELNEELEGLVAKVNDLEKILNDLVVKLDKKNENQVNIEEIHKKVVAHDSQIDNILITIEKNNDSKEKMKDCQECDLKFNIFHHNDHILLQLLSIAPFLYVFSRGT